MKEARYYETLEDKTVNCLLCPHHCTITEEEVGICRVRKNIDGKLHTLNYGKITSYAYDPIEKKPLYHFYPGSKIFSIGSFGCNLNCEFCQNWEIVYEEPLTADIKEEDIITLAKAKNSIGIAYTYNEPSIWFEYILNISKIMKKNNLLNVMITNGYINEEPLMELLPYIDGMNIDLKAIDDKFYESICNGKVAPVIKTIEIAAKYTHVEVTTMLIDGKNSSMEQLRELAKTLGSINRSIPLHLSKYFPAYKMKTPSTNIETLIQGRKIAKEYLDYVYIGNIWGIDNSTYCPKCNNKLIDRQSEEKKLGIKDRRCKKCQYKVNFKY